MIKYCQYLLYYIVFILWSICFQYSAKILVDSVVHYPSLLLCVPPAALDCVDQLLTST